ncbi:MAG: Bro-N domain-containing protein [Bacteroidales bacterium]|nr:Bro-N domain-containing protein [Bacteroidales bacterium]
MWLYPENIIQIFTNEVFGEIRTITNGSGETFFVGKDVAKALGYSNTRDALNRHVDAEDKGTVAIRDTAYETRVTLINESGLYALILSSKLEQAKAFKRWVTSEVLPRMLTELLKHSKGVPPV